MSVRRRTLVAGAASAVLLGLVVPGVAQAAAPVVDPPFDANYEAFDLGSVPGVPPLYGGLTLVAGDDDTLLIGGNANEAPGALYAIDVVRDADGHITGFDGTATRVIDAAYNDGGVTYGPGGVLFLARWPVNQLGQTKPGSTTTDKVIDTAALGVGTDSLGALGFVPAGFPGEGQFKMVNWEQGNWYTAGVAPDGSGTFDITGVTPVPASKLSGGPEGFIYVPEGSPAFDQPTMLVAEFSAGTAAAYDIDGNGDPIVASRKTFISGLEGAEGAFIDPVTGDFLFSTFGGGDRVVAVRGFEPPPPNNPPVATDVTVTTPFQTPVAIGLGGTDPDGDPVEVTSTSDPAHGSLTGALPAVTYTPDAGFIGTDTFDFVVDDGKGGTDLGTATIVVGKEPTTLVAHPAVLSLHPPGLTLKLAATLTGTSGPLAGETIRFEVNGTTVCTAVTDAAGKATCTCHPGPWLLAVLHLGYDAVYDGDETHLPSADHGPIIG